MQPGDAVRVSIAVVEDGYGLRVSAPPPIEASSKAQLRAWPSLSSLSPENLAFTTTVSFPTVDTSRPAPTLFPSRMSLWSRSRSNPVTSFPQELP